MATLQAALDALNNDSGRWLEVKGSLNSAAQEAAGLSIAAGEFPDRGSLEVSYGQLQDKMSRLLTEGRNNAQEIADELINVRTILQGTDEASKEDLERLWDFD